MGISSNLDSGPWTQDIPHKKNTPESPYPATTFLNFVDKEGERA